MLRFAIALCFLSSFLAIGWLSTRSTIFLLAHIEVDCGDEEIEKKLVRHTADLLGENMFSLSLSEIASELSSMSEQIKESQVRRMWPNRLKITAKVRDEVAFSNNLWAIDSEGVRFLLRTERMQTLPRLLDFSDARAKSEALQWLGRLKKSSPVFSSIESIGWKDDRGVTLRLRGSQTEFLLGFDQFDQAFDKIESLLSNNELGAFAPVLYVDASFKERVVLGYAEKLQNFPNGLNLKEIVRRRDFGPGSAAR